MPNTEPLPTISRVCPDGTIIEALFKPESGETAFAVRDAVGIVSEVSYFDLPDGTRLVPYSPTNNLLSTGCVLLPSAIGEEGDTGDVLDAVRGHLSRYVDLSREFQDVAAYYVLLTWVYDAFAEMPLIRFRGDFGTGKTRALLTLGSLCYKPFFASGASTVSPIFHILDAFRGTLVLDEADFRFSDATGELTKILNNGSMNGLPVLRTMTNRHRELNPQAFRVFGPKVIAMREQFEDEALESRLLTEEMNRRPLSPHIPIHTPAEMMQEATVVRNRLLTWRLRNLHKVAPIATRAVEGASARANQMAPPLLSLVDDEGARARIVSFLLRQGEHTAARRRDTPEAAVLAAIVAAFEETDTPMVRVGDVAERLNRAASERFHKPLSNKAVGFLIREKLGIPTTKSHGTYAIGQDKRERVYALADRYGVAHFDPVQGEHSSKNVPETSELHASLELS